MIYAKGGLSLPDRLWLLIDKLTPTTKNGEPERACFLSRVRMGEVLDASPEEVRDAMKGLLKRARISRVSWTSKGKDLVGFRVISAEPTDKQIEALNSLSARVLYCREHEVEEKRTELGAAMDQRKKLPSIYAGVGNPKLYGKLTVEGSWRSLTTLWGMPEFVDLLKAVDAGASHRFWISLPTHAARNPVLAGIKDPSVRAQAGLLMAASHVGMKVATGKWAEPKSNAAGLLLRIVATVDPRTDPTRLVSEYEVKADMAALRKAGQATVREFDEALPEEAVEEEEDEDVEVEEAYLVEAEA